MRQSNINGTIAESLAGSQPGGAARAVKPCLPISIEDHLKFFVSLSECL